MLRHLAAASGPRLERYDVCIIGAGAAGITLAQSLRRRGLSVFLAEGGGENWDEQSQDIYRGTIVGDEYTDLDVGRLRFFGGTTNHWGGMVRPLEEIDFDAKPGFPMTEWPISRDDLEPYLDPARELLGVAPFPQDASLEGGDLRRVHFLFPQPLLFGRHFYKAFSADDGIDVMLHANAQDVRVEGGFIRSIRFENYDNISINVSADAFVLSCGGIENSRLLLQWNQSHNNQLGNARDLVGRYWMEHPTQTIGEVLFCDGMSFEGDDVDPPLSQDRIYVAPTQSFMAKKGILNCRIRLDRAPSMDCTPPGWLADLLGLGPNEPAQLAWVRSSSEQEPVAENRVALADSRDRFGNPRAQLHWRRNALDKGTFRESARALGRYLADNARARMRLYDWVLSEELEFSCEGGGHCPGGNHHMGGTRMARTPQTGVVDRNAKVFGTENLFCAGSSIFPSAGFCNPTFSIVQLSLRLADHLAAR